MTFLPIVERELRVASRRSGTYWLRLAVALLATLIGAVILLVTIGFLSPQQTGQFIFRGLSGLLLLYCLAYGRRATADCLSVEKREGTLGLLFLTDLKGHDVVLGKLVATSLGGFYGLLAVVPVLSICLLLGGTTSGEFWRMVAVLVDSFLLSLTVGLFGSALTREFRRAMAANFLLLLLFVALFPAIGGATFGFSGFGTGSPAWFLSCPVYAYYLSFDSQYTVEKLHYWQSVGVIFCLAALLLLATSRVLPRTWQEKVARPKRARWRELWHRWSFGDPARRPAFRKRLLDVNAFYWLAARARLKPVHVWTFLGGIGLWWLAGWLVSGRLWLDPAVFTLTGVLLNFGLKVWVAIEAGQELADDQKSGAVELLLSVPLTVGDILHGQWLALRRQFLKPVLTAIGVGLLLMLLVYRQAGEWQALLIWLAATVMFVADLFALIWVAMARALTAKSHNHATISTLMRVLVLPWALFGLVLAAINIYYSFSVGPPWSPGWGFYFSLWFGLGLGVDLVFGGWAFWQLHHHFRRIALRRFDPSPSRVPVLVERRSGRAALPNSSGGGALLPPPLPKPPRRRSLASRWRIAALAAVLLAGILWYWFRSEENAPPPVEVLVSARRGELRVASGSGGVLFVLPDGSLWRWGRTEGYASPRAAVPERLGTDNDWADVSTTAGLCTGVRRDGTLWEWGVQGGHSSDKPQPSQTGTNWVKMSGAPGHLIALRRDGTLWEWGNAPSSSAASSRGVLSTNLVQVGTNADWVDFCSQWGGAVGLRKDGSLWVWGRIYIRTGGGMGTMKMYPDPTRLCQDTNWVALTTGFAAQAWTSSGELWDVLTAPADPNVPAASSCRLVVSNSAPGRVAVAYVGKPKVYAIHADRTLWERDYRFGIWGGSDSDSWRQVGKRSDWVSLWGGGGTALGVTSDGTIWTWGIDPGREPAQNFISELKAIRARMSGAGPMSVGTSMPFNKKPRPLLHLVTEPR